MSHWGAPPLDRQQAALFYPTLDETIPADHPVRLLDELLAEIDWTSWESQYHGRLGQPAIHPRIVAGIILYGLSLGLRSSRQLERACGNSLDFLWLSSGRRLDHSTLCSFRTKFAAPLKDLFRQVGRLAMAMGLVRLNEVGLDGTRVRANSSRHRTASASTLEERLSALDEQIEGLLKEAASADAREGTLYGEGTPNALPRGLADASGRRAALVKALEAARSADGRRASRGGSAKPAAKVPVADPESSVLPNKEGGHAPNYTPLAAVDGERGFVVAAEMVDSESGALVPTVDQIEADLGRRPASVLADGAYGTGSNLAAMEDREVEAYIPPAGEAASSSQVNPASRPDPRQAVAEGEWPSLPVNPQTKKLAKSCFIYDERADGYWCPMGRWLGCVGTSTAAREGGPVRYRLYRCVDCAGCPLGLSLIHI